MRHSESITKILPALAKAESEFPALKKEGSNTYFKSKYLQLDDLLDAIKPVLRANGIMITQYASNPASAVELVAEITTRFWHVPSGEWIEVSFAGAYGDDKGVSMIQSFGKTFTYLRRYEIVGFFSLGTEDDDDANLSGKGAQQQGAQGRQQQVAGKGQAQAQKSNVPTMTVNEFSTKWPELFDGDKDRATEALNSVLPPGRTFKEMRQYEDWLYTTYHRMRDELIAAAKASEEQLAGELASMTNGA